MRSISGVLIEVLVLERTYLRRLVLLVLTIIATLLSCSNNDQIYSIESAFQRWQKLQIENASFLNEENCNYGFVDAQEEYGLFLGFPDSYKYHFADINEDGNMDALVTFYPIQCDGGNMTAWMQYQILVVSTDSSYHVIDNYFDSLISDKASGFYILDSLYNHTFYGVYYDFDDDDGFCCPSINNPIEIDYRLGIVKIEEL